MKDIDILMLGNLPKKAEDAIVAEFRCRKVTTQDDLKDALSTSGETFKGIAGGGFRISGDLLKRLPNVQIVANFGVGYDGVDANYCGQNGIIVTNTPDVLTEEVADTALGLLLATVRELPAAERHLRAGLWPTDGAYPLSSTMRDRHVGIVGLGRIGLAIARRLDAMLVPVAYHNRSKRSDVDYAYYPDLVSLAKAVDTLMIVLPGSASTKHAVNAEVLEALGPSGVVINVGRGSVVDEGALIAALKSGTIQAAGLDVFEKEPHVPEELIALENTVLLPHVGSASVHTRDAMGMLVFENLDRWFETGVPVTPVPETPVRGT